MLRWFFPLFAAVVCGLGLGVELSGPGRRPPQRILAEYDAVVLPSGFLDDARLAELKRGCRRRCELARELLTGWPEHPRTAAIAAERWAFLENTFDEHDIVLDETARVLAQRPQRELVLHAGYARAWSGLHSERITLEQCLDWIDAARFSGLGDDDTVTLWLCAAQERTADPDVQRKLCARISAELPHASRRNDDLTTWITLLGHVGQPLDVEFVDSGTGKPASIERWRGRPILVHVHRASDWKPLPESALRASETRCATVGLAAIELVLGQPEQPAERPDQRITCADDRAAEAWRLRLGLRKTPMFFAVDRDGRLAGVSRSAGLLEQSILRDAVRR